MLEAHEYWQERGLMPLISTNYPGDDLDTALTKMASNLNSSSRTIDEIKEIIRGHRIDHELFGQFLQREGLNSEEVATYAPELVGINNETQARRSFEFALREMMNNREFTERINWGWHEHLDRNLGIVPALHYDRAIALRARNFAEIIYAKLGAEYFEDRAFVRHAISVFSGVAKDTKLLGLLINSVPRMDFNEAMRLYPNLTGPILYIPFERVQRMLQAKYPQGPGSDLDRFFKQTIYDDLGIDFAVLVNSITDYHRESDQPIIANSAREQIAEFLTKTYSTAAGDNSNHSYTQAMEHFNDISREILYNQILAKVWGINRILTVTNDDFKHTIQADRIDSESQAASPLEQAIDLNNANLQWIERINIAIQSKIPPTNLSLSLRKRVAIALENFTNKGEYRNNLDTEFRTNENDVDTKTILRSEQNLLGGLTIDQRTIDVLTGAVNPNELTDSDKDLFRAFAQSLDIGSEELITNFPRLAGIKNQEEATILIKNTLAGMDGKELQPDPKLIVFIGNPAKKPELVAEFLLTRHPDTLLDREKLKAALKLINGDFRTATDKASSQAYLRAYISFLADKTKDSPSPIKLRDIVIALPKLTGINDKPELIDAAKFPGRFDIAQAVTKSGNRPTLDRVTELGNNLDLSLERMAEIAKLKNPTEFYSQPIKRLNPVIAAQFNVPLSGDMIVLNDENYKVVSARNILHTIWGEKYKREDKDLTSSSFLLASSNSNFENTVIITPDTIEFNLKNKPNKPKVELKFACRYENGAWGEVTRVQVAMSEPEAERAMKSSPHDANWLKKMLTFTNQSYANLYKKSLEFLDKKHGLINTLTPGDKALFNAVLMGDVTTIRKNPEKNTQTFREWAEFLGMKDLDKVIAEFPKLTGVRDLRELELAADLYRKNNKIDFNFSGENSPNRPESILTDRILPYTGLQIADIKGFDDYKLLRTRYGEGLRTVLNERRLGNLVEPMLDGNTGTAEFLISNNIFPDIKEMFSRDILSPSHSLLVTIFNDYIQSFVNSTQLTINDAEFNSDTNTWTLRNYSDYLSSFNVIDNQLKNNNKLRNKYIEVLSEFNDLNPKTGSTMSLFYRLVDDFFLQESTLKSIPADNRKIQLACMAILGDDRLFKSNDKRATESAFVLLRSFIDFAKLTYPGFAAITDEAVRKLLGIESITTARTPVPTSLIERIKAQYTQEEFYAAMGKATDSGHAELSRIAGSFGRTFDDLYREADLEDPSIKYNQSLVDQIKNMAESTSGVKPIPGFEAHVKDYFIHDVNRIKALELINAIWGTDGKSKVYVKPLIRLQQIWYTLILSGNNEIIMAKSPYGWTPEQAIDMNLLELCTKLGNLKYNKETKAWNFETPEQRALEIANKLKEQDIVQKLNNSKTLEEYEQILFTFAQQFNLSVKEMFNRLNIGFLLDHDGQPNQEWTNNLLNFINTTWKNNPKLPSLKELDSTTITIHILAEVIELQTNPTSTISSHLDLSQDKRIQLGFLKDHMYIWSKDDNKSISIQQLPNSLLPG